MDVNEELLELKQTLEEAKTQAAELKGKKKAILATLKSKFNCFNIKEAKKKASDLEDEISDLTTEIEEGVEALKEKHGL